MEKLKRQQGSTEIAASGSDAGLVARLADHGAVCIYPRNAVIQREGEPGETLCLVMTGRLKAFVGEEHDHAVQVDTLGPGDCVGLAMVDGGRRAVSVKCLTAVKACILTRAGFEKLIASDPEFAKYVLRRLVCRVRALTCTVRALALQDVQTRVIGLLRELARAEGGSLIVRPRISQREIADRVGASPAMISRVMRDLVAGGHVTAKAACIIVHKATILPARR
jgi:CRP/FNR family transcriptional regulator, cyclic AMP receptor protein